MSELLPVTTPTMLVRKKTTIRIISVSGGIFRSRDAQNAQAKLQLPKFRDQFPHFVLACRLAADYFFTLKKRTLDRLRAAANAFGRTNGYVMRLRLHRVHPEDAANAETGL